MDILRIEIPFPPSINHYYIYANNKVILSEKGKIYRRDVSFLCNRYRERCSKDMRLCVTINVFPPDKRKRDLDNLLKCTLDSLQHAGIYHDDNQIDMLTIIRRHVDKNKLGYLQIWISECSSNE